MDYLKPPPQYNDFRSRRHSGLWVGSKVSGVFTPASLPNLYAWWDYSNTSGKVHLSGSLVTSVDDCSAAGGPTMGDNNPGGEGTQSVGGLNGLNCVSLASGKGIATTNTLSKAQPYTWWSVVKITGGLGVQEQWMTDGVNTGLFLTSSNWAGNGGGTGFTSSIAADNNIHLIIVTFNGASSSYTVDGTTVSGLTCSPRTFTQIWNGWTCAALLGETGITLDAMSSTNRTNMRTYASAKWGTP
ncbi:MAG TPA: hypothetical protein VNM39_15240 [Verrucomicrobiae bacterium]|nr:hypothetical protein [Verrucomicrobiae bacterium]